MRLHLLLASVVALVSSGPVPDSLQTALEPRYLDCKAVNKALTVLKGLGAPATKFCSSYLSVPYTTTQTVTAATTTVTTATITVLSKIQCPVARVKARATDDNVSGYDIIRTGARIIAKPKKHGAREAPMYEDKRTVNPLPGLGIFAASKISSACSCLSIGPKTTTQATITLAPQPTTVTVTLSVCTAPPGSCGPPGFFCDRENYQNQCCPNSIGSITCIFTGGGNIGQCYLPAS